MHSICEPASGIAAVTVDFSQPEAPPLVKKYGVFNSGLVSQSQYTPGDAVFSLL